MILWESDAYQYAQDHADTLVAIQFFGSDVCRVVLDGEPEIDPECPAIVETWVPELPLELREINAALEAAGWPAMTPFWCRTIALCYFAGRKNQIFRVGRRGGKSTAIERVAIYECKYGKHEVPPGDVGVFAILSALVSQAKDRLKAIGKACEALGIDVHPTLDTILFKGTNRAIRCYAATKQAAVSFTSIGAMCDEEAYWKDEETGANPAQEVLGALRPTMATQPNAKLWHMSAPWSTLDAHYEAFERGLQPDQICFYAPTWIANNNFVSEAETHLLEPDEPTWERQYKAIPSAADETKFFNAALIEAARKINLDGGGTPVAGGDFAFRRDSSALVIADGNEGELRVIADHEWRPGRLPLRPTVVISEAIGIAKDYRCESICCDLHYVESVREETDEQEMGLSEFPTDSDRIAQAHVKLRVMLSRGKLDLSRASVKLIKQLKETTSKITQSGMHFDHTRDSSGHGDIVSALVCASWSKGGGRLGSNTAGGKRRIKSARHEPPTDSHKMSDFAPED